MDEEDDISLPPTAGGNPPAVSVLGTIPTDCEQVLTRALATRDLQLVYKLGAGRIIRASSKLRRGTPLDCSEWLLYVLGIDKLTREPIIVKYNGGWFNSSGVIFDARQKGGVFSEVKTVRPGDILAVPKRGAIIGHVVLVLTTKNGRADTVIECSSYHYRRTGNAIGIRPAQFMYDRGCVQIRADWL